MGLFKKNPNETAYVGGQKHWADVIKNTGFGGDMIWRQPEEDFNTNSTLIVMPGEEAVFIKGGNIEEVFSSGTYQLSTENYPFISRLRNAFTGGISTFNCVVYFVRTASSMEIRWGTDSPIQVRDKLLGIQTDLLARGSYKVKVGNAGKFLTKLIGNNISSFSPEEVQSYFGRELLCDIKSCIAETVNSMDCEILGIAGRQRELSRAIEPELAAALEEYGVELLKFSISGIDVDDNELRRRYDEIGMDAMAKLRNAQADKGVMDILGQNWQAQQQVDIMKTMVQNQGDASLGANIGMGMAAGAAFFGMGQQMMSPAAQGAAPQGAPVPPPVKQYYAYVGGQQLGPMPLPQLSQYVQGGQIDRNTLVWCEGMADWAAAGSVQELRQLFGAPVPPPPPVL